jgi:hypothetical protein
MLQLAGAVEYRWHVSAITPGMMRALHWPKRILCVVEVAAAGAARRVEQVLA